MVGTYTDIGDQGTEFDTGYWQYGEVLVLDQASTVLLGALTLIWIGMQLI